jgi:glycosyltransferase involved in cell wall biosynthesis
MHVTVLLAVHNGADTLQRAIDSVRAQTFEDWELLVVDDASTDGSAALLQENARIDARITSIRNDQNRGLAFSLNRGWRAARGELIARLDADDVCLPERLQLQADFMAAHPEVAVLGGGAEIVDQAGSPCGVLLRPQDHETLAARIYRENPFIHPSVMARRSFFEAMGGYDERCARGQDYDLWSRAYRRFRFHNLPVPVIRYTVRDRVSWEAIRAGSALAFRLGARERRFVRGAWYAGRFFAAGALNRLGLLAGNHQRRAR